VAKTRPAQILKASAPCSGSLAPAAAWRAAHDPDLARRGICAERRADQLFVPMVTRYSRGIATPASFENFS
jgi:hypothetical protein